MRTAVTRKHGRRCYHSPANSSLSGAITSWTVNGLIPSSNYYLKIINTSGFAEEFDIKVEAN